MADRRTEEQKKLDVEKSWHEFWSPIFAGQSASPPTRLSDPLFVNYRESKWIAFFKQTKKELCDYEHMITQLSRIYMELTGGRMSYPNYFATDVLSEMQAVIEDDVANGIKEHNEVILDWLEQIPGDITIDKIVENFKKDFKIEENTNA